MADQMKNLLIGIFVVLAAAIVVFVLMFIHPSVGDQTVKLRVRFANIDKISPGTRVTFAGKPVGEVVEIRELPDAVNERKAINGFIYVYELTLRVDSSVKVFNTDEISARTSGLLGEKSVAIIPGAPRPGEELHVVNDEVIYATETGSVEDTLKDLKDLSLKIESALDAAMSAMTTLQDEKFWHNVSSTASHLKDITKALNEPKLWSDSLENIHQVSHKVNKSWDTVDRSLADISKTAANGVTISNKINSISDRISRGEGTIGKIVEKDDLYIRLVALTNKAETVMNDVNHYGVLFHLDKGWQRLRARRMNLLQKLCTPQEFRNYFNDEVDQISTSLERVSMVLEQIDNQSPTCCYDMLQHPEFTKVYAELMRRVAAIDESIKMYNQQVADTALQETELIDCHWCE
jgi:phospholipid/cholesterol/gamma-HCH transport system substrate-binding protein